MIDTAAERNPQRIAVQFLDKSLTYSELAVTTNSLAKALVEQGVRRRDRVGIYMDKCLESAIAMYGIMKAGAAYVPLDSATPAERLAFIIRDCGIRHLIAGQNKLRNLQSVARKKTGLECLIGIDADVDSSCRCLSWDGVFAIPGNAPPDVKIIEKDLAYIIYTSGSTGEPKGIMHTHHSGLAFANWASREYGLNADDRLSNHAPLHFDLSILDYFAGAAAGATTVIIPEEYTKLPASYSKLIADQNLTILYTVPFALIQLLLRGMLDDRDFSALRWIIFGGEPFPPKHLRALMAKLPHVRFDNIYGPAETNGCTHYTVPRLPSPDEQIPIGKMSEIADGLVVDDQDTPVDHGETGELLVRSPTMMQGYWGRPDLNARAFFRRPVTDDYQDVFYRTGDLVKQEADGTFRFLGRKDRQVKVRGYRVELDEIETALTASDAVEEAAAFSIPDAVGSQQIHGMVTLKQGAETTTANLLKGLETRLPRYAVPSALAIRDEFPRTSTGKINRRELRAQTLAEASGSTEDTHHGNEFGRLSV